MFHGINFTSISEATTMYLIVHGLVKVLYKFVLTGERSVAILMHYQHQVQGKGHISDSVLDCGQDKCAVFAA